MKKHEILKYAYDNYPKGTTAVSLGKTDHKFKTCGNYILDESGIIDTHSGWVIYSFIANEWSEIVQPRISLLTSIDGVELYEDDLYVMVKNIPATGNLWKITRENVKLKETHFAITDPEHCVAFSTKKAALDWIEAQKPKSYEVKLFNGGTANLYKDEIILHGGIKLKPSDLEDLIHSFRMYFGKGLNNA